MPLIMLKFKLDCLTYKALTTVQPANLCLFVDAISLLNLQPHHIPHSTNQLRLNHSPNLVKDL